MIGDALVLNHFGAPINRARVPLHTSLTLEHRPYLSESQPVFVVRERGIIFYIRDRLRNPEVGEWPTLIA